MPYIKIGMTRYARQIESKKRNFGLRIWGKDFKFYNRNEIENNSKRYSFFFFLGSRELIKIQTETRENNK